MTDVDVVDVNGGGTFLMIGEIVLRDAANSDAERGWAVGCVSTTAGMDLVMSVAVTAPKEFRSAPLIADSEMPMSCEFCSRFCAVTTISSKEPEAAGC